ncbi:MAG TPA: ATP synthase F0 subunit B [Polyangiales bacterium]|jgi:F-type H+-transporting ATPase subunit b
MRSGARFGLGAAALLGVALLVASVGAQGQPARERPGHAQGSAERAARIDPHTGRTEHGAPSEHAEHGKHAEHDENAPPMPINWWHGLLGEKADTPPGLLWREPGEPPPFLASLFNFGLLVLIVVRFGKKPLRDALVKRKETIVRELEDARRLREAAEKRLAEYQHKLEKIHDDLERVRSEYREQGELEKARILQEAKERRERMRKDAEVILSQEVKQMRQDLLVEVVREATKVARDLLAKEMTLGDHDRFAESFLNDLRSGSQPRGSATVSASAAARGGAA